MVQLRMLWGKRYLQWVLSVYYLVVMTAGPQTAKAEHNKDLYIVFLRDHQVKEEVAFQKHIDILSSLKGRVDAKGCHVHSYTKVFNAFAAKLSVDEAAELSRVAEVASVIRNQYHKLHTTRSWDFMGMLSSTRRNLKGESDTIVGVLDTGITPESQSFRDDSLGPPPAKWKGSCVANFSGLCNNKLIGAKYYKLDKSVAPGEMLSPRDVDGHGTHTSSIAVGSLVPNASLFGLAKGVARGAVPSARVAMYKVCWGNIGCADVNILAAFESAIVDGVDVISISVSGLTSMSYTSDSIAVGSFHAMRRGILTVASAGNDGPFKSSVTNHAPWILTVGASAIDRQFRSEVLLQQAGSGAGGRLTISGIAVNTFELLKWYPITTGTDAAKNSTTKKLSKYCVRGSMDPAKVKGKLVYCLLNYDGDDDSVVKDLGGIGTVLETDDFLDTAYIFMVPATTVSSSTGKRITHYINSTTSPSAVIHRSKEVKIKAPLVASFSSRGPNPAAKRLLKPDVVAPGIDILAAYTPLASLTGEKGDTRFSKFKLMSGTSMACPHVAGVAAYVKSFHPNWSPSAVKSAILTTATPMRSKEGEFAYGAGQVNPIKARSPGLVYDMEDYMSYIKFLCQEGHENSSALTTLIGGTHVHCSKLISANKEDDAINYPTMQLALRRSDHHQDQEFPTVAVFRRTVTNVGHPQSVYNATIRAPNGVEITVKPATLSFSRVMQKQSFKVVVKANPMSSTSLPLSGSLIWRSSKHSVRSPIVIYDPTR